MPAKSAKQYKFMQSAASGNIKGVGEDLAKEFIRKTPKKDRKRYGRKD
jgi:GTP cyclohydrolase I